MKSVADISSIVTLGWWQVRQAWRLLLVIGVGIIVAVTLACTVSLYSDVTMTAGLRDILTSPSQNTDIIVHSTSERLDSDAVKSATHDLNYWLQHDLGTFSEPAQFSIQTQEYPLVEQTTTPGEKSSIKVTDNVISFVSAQTNQAINHLSLLQGRLPGIAQNAIEIMLTAESASQLHVIVGSTLTVRVGFVLLPQYQSQFPHATSLTLDIPLRIVGIMQPPAAEDTFWHGTTFLSSIRGLLPGSIYTGLTSSEGYIDYFSRLFAHSDISKYTFELSCTLTWAYPFAASHIAIYDLNELEQDIHSVQADTSNDLYLNNPPLLEQTMTYLPTGILQRFEARVPVAQVPIASLFVMIVSLVLLFVGLMTTLLIDRQSSTIALLRSRGASGKQLFGAFVTQGVGLGLIALLIGPILAIAFVHVITHFTLSSSEQGALNIITYDFLAVIVRLVGYAGITIVVALTTMNGAAWSVVANPTTPLSDSVLNGVVALSPTNAWAVGYTFQDDASYVTQTLIEHWNGTAWKVVANPGPVDGAQLAAVAALSATDIWTVGYGVGGQTLGEQSLIEHWDGKKWREVQSPNPGNGFDMLNGLAAVSTNDVWTVGTFTDGNSGIANGAELIEHWNGASWVVVQGPNAGVQGNTLSAVAAISMNNIWAVGSSNGSSSVTNTLIEHWNGKLWSNVKGQNPGQASNSLSAITVLSAQNIWAVGSWSSAFTGPQAQPLIEHWNGSVWSTVKSPNIGTNTTTLDGAILVPHSTHIWAVGTGANDGIPIAVTVPPPGAGTYNVTPVTAQTLIEVCCS